MTAYRSAPTPLCMEEPPKDAAWYEHLAWSVVLAHQPAPSQRARHYERMAEQLELVRQRVADRARCRVCGRAVEELHWAFSEFEDVVHIIAWCHGEESRRTLRGAAIRVARTLGYGQLATLLMDAFQKPWFFQPPPGPEVP